MGDSLEMMHQDGCYLFGGAPLDSDIKGSEACWIPPGTAIMVGDYHIPDGMIYVGRQLQSLTRWSGEEAALIDPNLPVSRASVDVSEPMSNYPDSYSSRYITPRNRAAYLRWLSEGRRDPRAHIGYVRLFIYGLERRLLFDITAIDSVMKEVPVLLHELNSLYEVYGENHHHVNLAKVLSASLDATDYSGKQPPTDRVDLPYGWQNLPLKIALGRLVKNKQLLSDEWALALTRCRVGSRAVVMRCASEFDKLFRLRFNRAFPSGIEVAESASRLRMWINTSNPSLPSVYLPLPDLPDISDTSGPEDPLWALGNAVHNDLNQYSRLLGKGIDRNSIPAIATLPWELQERDLTGDAKAVVDLVEASLATSEIGVVKSRDLVARYTSKTPGKLTKSEAILLVEFLSKRGFGVEPDIRFGGANLSTTESCAVFRLTGDNHEPEDGYSTATLLLHLAVAVTQSDGDVTREEQWQLEQHLENALHLSERDRKRLSAHLCWLCADLPKLTVVKSRVEELDERQRRSVAQFLISISAADGRISPNEVRVLSKIYAILGLDPSLVYGDVHSLTIGDGGPVTVMRSDKDAKSYSIPQQPNPEIDKSEDSIRLDLDRINRIRENSEEAAELLSGVFATIEKESAEPTADGLVADSNEVSSEFNAGLDPRHAAFLRVLCERTHWSKCDFELLAQRFDLLPIGAIEVLNEISFEKCGEPLLEGDDPIEINQFALSEYL